ncbi:CPBP family intramembrane metalloprotease [Priestia megaterium]|uniref:CPBP family intramembrane metalloprotease n=1 Tax=Priestia megaterium TaxID=1404 RepID=A0A3D8X0E8_PRIMG|nr:CPBP family intramembrane glutamic endopeptidase [Priestia megaterium]MDH3171201.1 CPBP family intramembrane metalloprotease [Priestia megaterium]RDZ13381.1 CPBP family intramembrane metalloprotease [Priestia megaterium]
MIKSKLLWKVIGLEILVIFWFVVNGAYMSMTHPTTHYLQFLGIIPLAIGIAFYLTKIKKWPHFFSFQQNMSFRTRILFLSPLLLYLLIILIENKGVHGSSIVDLVLILLTQTLVVAFVEEMVFRGFILNLLLSKSYKAAILLSSLLFAFTHSLNMLSGQSVGNTIFQILFAFIIGVVLALLIVNGQSIGITIVFHGLNNFLQFTSPVDANDSLVMDYALLLFLSGYAFYLWNRKSTLSVSHNQVSS